MKRYSNGFILSSLVFTVFITSIPSFLSGLLLIEIGDSFNVPIAVAAQMRTASYVVSIVFAFLTGVLSLRYSSKFLIQIGVGAFIIAALGSSTASDLGLLIFFFSFTGVGFGLATSMVYTLVAKFFQGEKRGRAIGWIIAGGSGSYLVGAIVVPLLQSIGGWRYVFQAYMLPCSAVALVLVTVLIPNEVKADRADSDSGVTHSYKRLVNNRSALYSLLGYLLAVAAWQTILSYNSSFYREEYLISLDTASYTILLGAFLYTLGSLISGKIAYGIGLKKYSVSTIIVSALGIMVYSYIPSFLGSVIVFAVTCLSMGLYDAAATSLLTEQAPEKVSIMMSLSRVSVQQGNSIGAGLGGYFLLHLNYQSMFTLIGGLGIISAYFYYMTHTSTQAH